MKKYTTFAFLFLLGFVFTSSGVFAEEGSGGGLRPAIRYDIKDTRAGIRDIRQESQGERDGLSKDKRIEVGEIRKDNFDNIANLRLEAKSKVESGEQKPEEAFKALREQVKGEREKTKEEIKGLRNEFQSSLKENKESAGELIKEKREGLLEGIQDKRDLFKEEFEARKEEMKAKREEMKAKFKESLGKIKDETKKLKVENITNNIAELNIKITEKASLKVGMIETVLVTIESRADKAAANGIDVASVRTLITSAETAIADARTAIANQVGKVYPVTIASDSTAKSTLETTRDLFKADIKAMNEKIKAAHEATRNAAEALKAIPRINEVEVEESEESDTGYCFYEI